MSHEETLYARFLSGDLSSEEIRNLKASGEWNELEAIKVASDNLGLPAFDVEEGFSKLKDRKSGQKKGRIISLPVISIAASFLLLVTLAYFFIKAEPSINAEYAQTLQHALPDESTVTLNDGSTIDYESKAWMMNREIKLKGEALFEVKSGSQFNVITKNGNVQVLGTRFNVRAWGDVLSVECYSGKVLVQTNVHSDTLTKYQSIYFVNGERRTLGAINYEKPRWSTGSSVFKEELVSNVFEEMERQFNVQIQTEIGQQRFSGSFQHQSLAQALEQVCKPLGLQFELDDSKSARVFE